ncbi:MAG: 16S rRNA (adenine(1518)-N(6)/adenine(1519)-N(6))-dimethyltransferase RsmA [Parachlamydiaceae bacterium]
MSIYKPSELRQFLEHLGVSPKKGLSQNFLIDGNILRKIVATAQLSPGDHVVEIGPGPGALTEQLLAVGAHVIAIEKDPVYAKALDRFEGEGCHLEVHCDDAMEFDLEAAVRSKLKPGQKAKVIANLPYHLTTPIIARLITMRECFSSLVLMVQEEVARRFVAHPKTSEYSSFTVFLNFYSRPAYAFTVSRQCFYPSPKVDSAIVVLTLQQPPEVLGGEDDFFVMTRTAFKQRRKMLRGSLKGLYPPEKIESSLQAIGKNPLSRPEELSLEDFLKFFADVNIHKL